MYGDSANLRQSWSKPERAILTCVSELRSFIAGVNFYIIIIMWCFSIWYWQCHRFPDTTESSRVCTSGPLGQAEKNYAQIEKDAHSIIFGVRKFHMYLYRRTFTLITDHKPLTTILGPKTDILSLAAVRMQRWALILAGYGYEIQNRKSS